MPPANPKTAPPIPKALTPPAAKPPGRTEAAQASLHTWVSKGVGETEWTVGLLSAAREGVLSIADAVRLRCNALDGGNRIREPAEKAGRQAPIFFEGEEGVSGKIVNDNDQRLVPPVNAMRGSQLAAPDDERALPILGGFRGWARQGVSGAMEREVSNQKGDDLRQDGGTRRPDQGAAHAILAEGRGAPFTGH